MSEDARVRLVRWGLIAAALVALEVVPRLGLVNPIALVPLSEMVWQLWLLISDGILGSHIARTLTSIVAAGAAAVITGLPLGVLLWRVPRVQRVLQPYMTTYYAIPIFAFYPLFIAIFGLSAVPVIIIAWAWAVVAIVINTVLGLNEVPEVLVKVGRSLRLSPRRMFTQIYFPAAVPYIFTGLKLAASYTVIGVVASEFIQAEEGVGWFVGFSYNNFAIQNMYAAILLILAFAVVVNSLLLRLERRLHGRQA
jgi:NitT/TauT family transport system permease protein